MKSPFRRIQEELFEKNSNLIKGVVVNAGSGKSPLALKNTGNVKKIINIDCVKYPCVDIVCDICKKIELPNKYADTIICTNLLEHLREPFKAMAEIKRILKTGGTVIFVTPFLYPYHPDPKDYYRYTKNGVEVLFEGFGKKSIFPMGGKFLFLLNFFYNLSPKYLNGISGILYPIIKRIDLLLDKKGEKRTMGFFVIAKK